MAPCNAQGGPLPLQHLSPLQGYRPQEYQPRPTHHNHALICVPPGAQPAHESIVKFDSYHDSLLGRVTCSQYAICSESTAASSSEIYCPSRIRASLIACTNAGVM